MPQLGPTSATVLLLGISTGWWKTHFTQLNIRICNVSINLHNMGRTSEEVNPCNESIHGITLYENTTTYNV